MSSASENGSGTDMLRVKLMDGRELTMEYSGQMTVKQLAAEVCSAEDKPNSTARLIHSGVMMVGDRTIGSYSIATNSVIHAVLSDPEPEQEPASASNPHAGSHDSSDNQRRGVPAGGMGAARTNAQTYEGVLLMIPPGVILMFLWSLAVHWARGFFNLFSWGSLVALTALYCLCLLPVLSSTFGAPDTERGTAGHAQRQQPARGDGQEGGDRAGVADTLRGLVSSPEAQSWAIKLSVFVAIFAAFVAQVPS